MSQYHISTRDLGRRPGSMREFTLDITAEHALGNEVLAVPVGASIHLDLRLEAVMDGVLVTGSATATAQGECSRCLDPISEDLEVTLTEMFAYPDKAREVVGKDEGDEEEELRELDGDIADIEETLTDAIVLSLPLQPLCRPDCPGLCPDCGVKLADAEPGHSHEKIDPRWAALEGLRAMTEAGEEAADQRDSEAGGEGDSTSQGTDSGQDAQ